MERNPTSIHEDEGSIPVLAHWVKGSSVAVSGGVGQRHGSDPALLWLWCRPAAAAPIPLLAWELPHTMGAALKKKKEEEEEDPRPGIKTAPQQGQRGILNC